MPPPIPPLGGPIICLGSDATGRRQNARCPCRGVPPVATHPHPPWPALSVPYFLRASAVRGVWSFPLPPGRPLTSTVKNFWPSFWANSFSRRSSRFCRGVQAPTPAGASIHYRSFTNSLPSPSIDLKVPVASSMRNALERNLASFTSLQMRPGEVRRIRVSCRSSSTLARAAALIEPRCVPPTSLTPTQRRRQFRSHTDLERSHSLAWRYFGSSIASFANLSSKYRASLKR